MKGKMYRLTGTGLGKGAKSWGKPGRQPIPAPREPSLSKKPKKR